MTVVDACWARIEAYLATAAPHVSGALRAGAAEEEIVAAEAELGHRMPDGLRESFRRHDGQEFDSAWMVDGGLLCSLSALLDEWREWTSLQESGGLAGFEEDAQPDLAVRGDQWWRRRWLPIVARDGDHLIVDLDPTPAGTVGQVFAFSHETGPGRVAAPSYGAWLTIYVEELERGLISFADAGDDEDEDDAPPLRTWPY